MNRKDINNIYSVSSITQVLSCIMQDPNILSSNFYNVEESDFPSSFHKIVFGTISNLIADGVEVIDISSIVGYISAFPTQKVIFESNNGVDYLESVYSVGRLENFEYHYNNLKKHTVLRKICESGMDVSDLFDTYETDPNIIEAKNSKLSSMTVSEVINHFMLKLTSATEGIAEDNSESFNSSDSIDEIIENLGKNSVGVPFTNEIMTTATKGQVGGKFVFEATGTGGMKSRKMIRECCNLAIPYLFNLQTNKWEKTKIPPQEVLYINTELNREEITYVMLAYLTGIDSEKIELNKLTDEERERIDFARVIIKAHPIRIVIKSEYDIADITRIIEFHVHKYNIGYVYFDYIMSNAKLLASASALSKGSAIRDDQVLLMLATRLKDLARKHNLFVYSATQQNGSALGDGEENRGVGVVRGAKSLCDKGDMCTVVFRPTKRDFEKIDTLLQQFGTDLKVNYGYSIFKNRSSKITGCYVFTHLDGGNMREVPILVTDTRYNPIQVETLEIAFDDEIESDLLSLTEKDIDKIDKHFEEIEQVF